jgi:hypothetical protein
MSKPVTHIDGKPIKDYVDLPFGAFEKLAREKVDPLWGTLEGGVGLKRFRVTCDWSVTERGSQSIEVEAANEKDAEALAEAEFDAESWDDYDITDVEEQ